MDDAISIFTLEEKTSGELIFDALHAAIRSFNLGTRVNELCNLLGETNNFTVGTARIMRVNAIKGSLHLGTCGDYSSDHMLLTVNKKQWLCLKTMYRIGAEFRIVHCKWYSCPWKYDYPKQDDCQIVREALAWDFEVELRQRGVNTAFKEIGNSFAALG